MRQTSISVLYNDKNITKDITPFLVAFSFSDNADGEADDLQLTLENTSHLWEGDWLPEKGDSIEAAIVANGFRLDDKGEDIKEQLHCGYFEVDEINISSPPSTITIKAISACDSTALRGEENTKAWENITLKAIAADISTRAEMDLNYLAAYNPIYKRRDQTNQSDLAFLQELCQRGGLALKVTDDTIVIFDEEEQEKITSVATFEVGKDNILNYSFKTKTRDVYRACLIQYTDSKTNKTTKYIFEPPNPPPTGKLMKINEKVESMSDAQRLARKRLREKNIKENTADITVVGDTRLVAGSCIEIKNVGSFSGKYYINKANHSYGTGGYTVSLDMHKAGLDYNVHLSKFIEVEKKRKPRARKAKKSKNKKWVGNLNA